MKILLIVTLDDRTYEDRIIARDESNRMFMYLVIWLISNIKRNLLKKVEIDRNKKYNEGTN